MDKIIFRDIYLFLTFTHFSLDFFIMDIYPKFLESLFQTIIFGLVLIIICIFKKYNLIK